MDEHLHNILSNIKLFHSLTPDELKEMTFNVRLIQLSPGDILFKQGSLPDSVYILIKGELVGYILDKNNKEIFSSVMEPEELIGELGALSNEPRSLTIRAADNQDVELIEIPSEHFKKLCQIHPNMLYEIVLPMITRTQSTIKFMNETNRNWIYLVADKDMMMLSDFKAMLKQQAEEKENTVFLEQQDYSKTHLHKMFHQLQHQYENILIWIDNDNYKMFDKLYRISGGKVYFIVEATNKQYEINSTFNPIYRRSLDEYAQKPYFILLHPEDTSMPKGTANWYKQYQIKQHYHVRLQHADDHARLLRFLTGQATGIVMSGGGTRVIAHAGLLKALMDRGVTIDATGGTSGGAMVASAFLLHRPFEEFMKILYLGQHAAYRSFSYKDFTFPLISFFSGRSLTQAMQTIYGETDIEDLWLPFFCITANLTNFTEVVHHTGKLWEKLRSSIAIPGILSPMILDGELHFDGGLINNLPVDVMKLLCGSKSTVMASYLLPVNQRYQTIYNFPPILTFKETLLSKLRLTPKKFQFPPFFEILLNALLLGSHSREVANCAAADILVNPDLSKYGFMSAFTEEIENELINKGYQEGIRNIDAHQELLLFSKKDY